MQSWSTWLGALTVLGLGGFLASGCDEASASTTDGGTELDARTGTDAADEYNEFVSDDGTVKVKVGKAYTPDGGLVISVFTDANIPDPFEEAIQASGGSLHGPIKAFEITPAGAIFDPPVEVSVLFDNPPPEDEPPVFVPLLLVDDSVGGLDQVRSPHHADASTEVRFVTPRAGSFAVAYGYAGVTVTHENQPGTRDVGIPFENTFTVSFDDTRVKKYGFHLSSDDCVEETGAAATQYSTTAVTPPATAPAMPH
ncbi:MAG: hypothetical protein KC417_14730, partial [Myxococcales bacterium]|nr:hypothetical protein [Myxococcales bacterium]